MSIETINISNKEVPVGIVKDCHLCGLPFSVDLYNTETICPKCRKIWREIIEKKEVEEVIKTTE